MSPRVYRPRLAWAVGIVLMALAPFGVGGVLVVDAFTRPHPHGVWPGVLAGLAVASLGALVLVALAVDHITLDGDTVEVRRLGYGRHRLKRGDIRGYRVLQTPYIRTLLLERSDGGKPVRYSLAIARDAAFDAWLSSLRDLDAADRAVAEAALLADITLGATPDARREALQRARRIARIVNGGGLALALWAVFLPHPYLPLMSTLAAMPVLALALAATGGGLYDLEGRARGARPHLALALLMPGAALALRALHDVSTLEPTRLGIIASVVTLGIAALAGTLAPERRLRMFALGVLLFSAYGGGVSWLGNAVLDWHPSSVYETRVLGEHVTHGRDRTAYLRLDAWGPVQEPDDYMVSFGLHDAVRVGDAVCVRMGPGALAARWYVVERCR